MTFLQNFPSGMLGAEKVGAVRSFSEKPTNISSRMLVIVPSLLLLFLGAASIRAGASSQEEDPGPQVLLARAFQNLYAIDYLQTMELVTLPEGGRGIRQKLQIIRKQSSDPGKALVRFLEPPYMRKTSFLIIENEGPIDDIYIYLPSARITKHLSSSQRSDAFFGTDFTFEDVEPKRASDYKATAIDDQNGPHGECTKIQLIPNSGANSGYDRLIACIDETTADIHSIEFIKSGRLIKVLEVDLSSLKRIGNRTIPFVMTMRSKTRNSSTTASTDGYAELFDIPEEIFSTLNLESGDARRDRARVSSDM